MDDYTSTDQEIAQPKCRGVLNIPVKPTTDSAQPTTDVEQVKSWALRGKINCSYPETAKIVRIFTSSTFTDTRVERNALMSRVYPKLRNFCRERGYDFQVVDMRWGVRDEATDDHMTSELCMRELAKCQKLSTGPVFITFLAQKYGYRPFPPKIAVEEFDSILKGVEEDGDRKLLTDWFVRDDNRSPPIYQLSSIRQKLPDYANDEDPEAKKQARSEWWAAFEKMQVILRQAASKQLKDELAIHKYYWAVTEEEIYNGILAAENTNTTCYWFRRTLEDLVDHTEDKMARRFMDIVSGAADEEALTLLNKLKDEKIPNKIPAENITNYTIQWTDNGVDTEIEEHEEYINTFCEDFERVLTTMIDNGIEMRAKYEVTDDLALETMKHAQFAQRKCQMFSGRQEFLNEIKKRITPKKKGCPLVICGQPGSGKTSVMAKLASVFPEWLKKEDLNIVVRFLGTSTASSNTRDFLRSICSQLHQLQGKPKRSSGIPTSLKERKEYFKKLLAEQTSSVVILLDSLDQLRDYGSNLREWIPTTLPVSVKMVLSCIPGEEFKVGPELQAFLPPESFLEVPEFSEGDIVEVIQEWLKSGQRALKEDQMKILTDACQACSLPLYTKLAYDNALLWRSYTPLEECSLGQAVHDSIELLFERIEKYHGILLVRRAFGYITLAKSGLSTNEIEDILSLDDEVLNDVYQYHTPPLRRLPPLLWVRIQDEADDYLTTAGADGIQVVTWFHRQFRTVATERYVTGDTKSKLHEGIVEYFLGQWADGKTKAYVDRKGNAGSSDRLVPAQPYYYPSGCKAENLYNLRKMSELPYQLTELGDKDRLKEHTFFNFDYLYHKINALSLDSVLEDLDYAKSICDEETEYLYRCLELSRDSLVEDMKLLPSCLLGRLGSYDNDDHPALHRLLDQAARQDFNCLYSSQGLMKLSGGNLVGKFVGHTEQIYSMAVSKDKATLISMASDTTLRVWNITRCRQVKTIDLSTADQRLQNSMRTTTFCNRDRWAVLAGHTNYVGVLDLETGDIIRTLELNPPEEPSAMCYMEAEDMMFFMQPSRLSAWNIVNGTKVHEIKTTKNAHMDPSLSYQPLDYLQDYNDYLIYYKKGTGVLTFVHFHSGKKKTETFVLYSKKDAALRWCSFATLDDGVVVCYHFQAAPWAQEPRKAIVDIVDIKTAAHIHSFRDIDKGYNMNIEVIVATGPSTFAMPVFVQGSTVLKTCDISAKKKVLKDALTMQSSFPAQMAGVDQNRVILIYMTEMSVMEFIDLNKGDGDKEAGQAGSGLKEPEMYDIVGCLPDSSRYVACTTAGTFALAIWDLYTRRTVRIIENSFVNTDASFPSTDIIVGVEHKAAKVCAINMVQGKVVVQKAGLAMKPIDNQLITGMAEDGSVVVVGPKANQLSGIDCATGKCRWSIDAGVRVKLGGLIVSENGRVAVCETPLNPTQQPNQGQPKESKLNIFDLKSKKKLPDMKYTSVNPLRSQLARHDMGFLTPDGAYFVVAAYGDNMDILVHSTKEGKTRKIPTKCSPSSLCYSSGLKSVVLTDAEGILELWTLRGLKKTVVKVDLTDSLLLNGISKDGTYAIVMRTITRNMIYIVDLVQKRLFATYRADNEIAKSMFTLDNHFLLVATRTNPGLIQLCMYEAAKGCPALTDSQVADSDKEETGVKGAAKAAANGAPVKGRADCKTTTKGKAIAKTKGGKNCCDPKRQSTSGSAEQTESDGPTQSELGPTLEKLYLEELKDAEDIFGEPAQFDCKI